eukprot:scaffold7229_cov114-Isochrysis_galbana.AAC.1
MADWRRGTRSGWSLFFRIRCVQRSPAHRNAPRRAAPRPAALPSLSSYALATASQVPMANFGCGKPGNQAAARCLGGALAYVARARAQPSTARVSWSRAAPRRIARAQLPAPLLHRCGSRLSRCHTGAPMALGLLELAELAAAALQRILGQPAHDGQLGACLRALWGFVCGRGGRRSLRRSRHGLGKKIDRY